MPINAVALGQVPQSVRLVGQQGSEGRAVWPPGPVGMEDTPGPQGKEGRSLNTGHQAERAVPWAEDRQEEGPGRGV